VASLEREYRRVMEEGGSEALEQSCRHRRDRDHRAGEIQLQLGG